MNLVIRHATSADATRIASYNLAFARETEDRTLNRRLVGAGVRTLLAEPTHGFYVVADNGKKVIGMAMITYEWSDWLNQQWWWLQRGYVDPEFRRQGVFSKIYNYISELAEQKGNICGIRLYAEKDNRSAHRTYRTLGMEKCGYRIFQEPLGGTRKKRTIKSSRSPR